MKITVIGCGRWGSLIAWYLDGLEHDVTLYGRSGSKRMERFLSERKNEYLILPKTVGLSSDISSVKDAEVIIISVDSQGLSHLMDELAPLQLTDKIVVLCMKGIEISTGKRLSEVASNALDPSNRVAVWLGPGHVEEFYRGVPNCMVIDSEDEKTKKLLIEDFVGNELGAAAKNVVGIAAGMLDGLSLSTLKGALMSRGTREVAKLIKAMGGNELSAYGLCHLGDYEATVFSKYSHNRAYGEALVRGSEFDSLAEGYYTVKALIKLGKEYDVELPICDVVYRVIYEEANARDELGRLFERTIKNEF